MDFEFIFIAHRIPLLQNDVARGYLLTYGSKYTVMSESQNLSALCFVT